MRIPAYANLRFVDQEDMGYMIAEKKNKEKMLADLASIFSLFKFFVLAVTYFCLQKTIIGTTVLNGSVRNGKRCGHCVKPPKQKT